MSGDASTELMEALLAVLHHDRAKERRRLYEVLRSASLYVPARHNLDVFEPAPMSPLSRSISAFARQAFYEANVAARRENELGTVSMTVKDLLQYAIMNDIMDILIFFSADGCVTVPMSDFVPIVQDRMPDFSPYRPMATAEDSEEDLAAFQNACRLFPEIRDSPWSMGGAQR